MVSIINIKFDCNISFISRNYLLKLINCIFLGKKTNYGKNLNFVYKNLLTHYKANLLLTFERHFNVKPCCIISSRRSFVTRRT